MAKGLVVVGSLNMDLVLSLDSVPVAGQTLAARSLERFVGGKGANQAAAAAKLGMQTLMIGKTGRDEAGERIRRELAACGVAIDPVGYSDAGTGTAVILRERDGENRIILVAGANAELKPQDIETHRDLLTGAGMILTQLETPLETLECLVEIADRGGVPVMLDPAPFQPLPPEILRKVTWLTPNQTEANVFLARSGSQASAEMETKELAEEILRLGPANVVLKRGSLGSFLATADGLRQRVEAFPVKAVDTTAAGDAFNAAFASALMRGDDVLMAGRFASATGALTVGCAGALPSLPSLHDVMVFLAKH
jgi:ribokinase